MGTQQTKSTNEAVVAPVTMAEIVQELQELHKDSLYIHDLYKDMVAYLKQHVEQGSRVFHMAGMKFTPKYNIPALHLHLLTKYSEDQIDIDLLYQLLTIYSMLEKKEIPNEAFCVTFEFPALYQIVTKELP